MAKKPLKSTKSSKKAKKHSGSKTNICFTEGIMALLLKHPQHLAGFNFVPGINIVQITGDNPVGVYVTAQFSLKDKNNKNCLSDGNLFIPWDNVAGLFIPTKQKSLSSTNTASTKIGFHTTV